MTKLEILEDKLMNRINNYNYILKKMINQTKSFWNARKMKFLSKLTQKKKLKKNDKNIKDSDQKMRNSKVVLRLMNWKIKNYLNLYNPKTH